MDEVGTDRLRNLDVRVRLVGVDDLELRAAGPYGAFRLEVALVGVAV